ncbi:MAG: CPBP family intramembrane metalloprotease [Oscillospiraceae bacterium]|nr:CPBP family intramembrane metalloprotease [Oscillospiraceae bacterium]
MKNKNILLITAFSLFACTLHGLILHTPFNDYIYTSAAKVILFMLCPLLYFKFSKEGTLRDLFRIKVDKKSIIKTLLLGIITFSFVFVVFAVIRSWLDSSMIINAMSNVGIDRNNYIFAVMYYILVNVALEELFFRGFVFLVLYKMNYKRFAFVYSSVLFAVYHIAVMKDGVTPSLLVLSVIGLIGVGLLFNEITRRYESAFGSFMIHVSASLAISLIGFNFLY